MKKEDKNDVSMFIGFFLGIAIGLGVGLVRDNLLIWMPVGISLGFSLGIIFKNMKDLKFCIQYQSC